MALNPKKLFFTNYRKYIVSGFIISGFVVLLKYSQYKLNEWRKQEVQQLLLRSKRRQHFESVEKSCNQTVINLTGCIKQNVLKLLDTSATIQTLKDGQCDKVAYWNKLKVDSVCKSVVVVYANSILAITLRIKLSLTSAYMFKNSQETSEISNLDNVVQQQYLTLCSYFVEHGLENLIDFVKKKVEEILKTVTLTEKLNIRDIEQIYWTIMSSILSDEAQDPVKNLSLYVLPRTIDCQVSDVYKKIINSTLDLLESHEVQYLMQSVIRSGFVLLIDCITQSFIEIGLEDKSLTSNGSSLTNNVSSVSQYNNNSGNFIELHKIKVPMAKIIPILTRQVDSSAKGDFHNIFVENLISNDKCKTFAANIYEAFSF